ncbi:MAG: glycogen synthase, partial [Deltaproteobacteria bacterium]
VLPAYRVILESGYNWRIILKNIPVPLGNVTLPADVLEGETHGSVRVYLIDREDLFDRNDLYGDRRGDYYDNLERYSFFCHSALRLANHLSVSPHILHLHDWQTGLVPALLKGPYRDWSKLNNISTVFTIHNLGYQGIFDSDRLPVTGLSYSQFFHMNGLEYWGAFSLLKSGIVYADAVTTVSSTYAEEIQTDEGGLGMGAVLRSRGNGIRGILNGVDYSVWNPKTDPYIYAPYSIHDLKGKNRCKTALMRELKLDSEHMASPLLCMISRLDVQKGFDLLLSAVDDIMETGANLVILGSGNRELAESLKAAEDRYCRRMVFKEDFEPDFAHRLMAGGDIFIMPSLYEPCGMTQMYALKYGTVPVVRRTGGLADTVFSYDPSTGKGNGFTFQAYDKNAFSGAVRDALHMYYDRENWKIIMQNGMRMDFSWNRSADAYAEIYRSIRRPDN